MKNKTNKSYTSYKTYKSHKTYVTYFAYAFLLSMFFPFFPQPVPIAHAALISRPPTNLGLVGYWPMDEGVGVQAGDISGNGNTGTITSSSWTNGKYGKALKLTQSGNCSSYANIGDPSSGIYDFGTGDFTVAFWVKKRVQSSSWSNTWGIEKWNTGGTPGSNEWGIGLSGLTGNDSTPSFSIESGTTQYSKNGTYSMNLNTWYHLVGVRNGTAMRLYMNAVAQGTDTVLPSNTAINNVGRNLTIGYSPIGVYCPNADFDDIRIYNRALSATEVSKLYSSGEVKVKQANENGLVGYWSMNEGRGTIATDSSGQRNNGTISGATWTDGKHGKALSFNGSSSYVRSATFPNFPTTVMTACAWLKTTSSSSMMIFQQNRNASNYQNEALFNVSSGKLFFYDYATSAYGFDGTTLSNTLLNDGKWHLGCFVKNGTSGTYYLDGIQDGTKTAASNVLYGTNDFVIGKDYRDNNTFFNGLIDEVRIYNRALSASEIAGLYQSGSKIENAGQNNKLTNGLVGLWSFNAYDISGTTAYDRSGQGNNGTLTNMSATTSPAAGKVGQALKFDKVDDYVDVGSPAMYDNLPTLSYCAWVKPNTFGEIFIGMIFAKGFSKYFGITDSNKLNFTVQYDGVDLNKTTVSDIVYGIWSHVCATWAGGPDVSSVNLYVNGVSVSTTGSSATGTTLLEQTEPYAIGNVDGATRTFDGLIDEVRLYNRALSADEVKQLYRMGQ